MVEERTPEERFIEAMQLMRLRQGRGWSQERLAEEVRGQGYPIPSSAITKLEWVLDPKRRHQARGLRLNEADAIARSLGTDIETMMLEDDPRRSITFAIAKTESALAAAQADRAQADARARELAAYLTSLRQALPSRPDDRVTSPPSRPDDRPRVAPMIAL